MLSWKNKAGETNLVERWPELKKVMKNADINLFLHGTSDR